MGSGHSRTYFKLTMSLWCALVVMLFKLSSDGWESSSSIRPAGGSPASSPNEADLSGPSSLMAPMQYPSTRRGAHLGNSTSASRPLAVKLRPLCRPRPWDSLSHARAGGQRSATLRSGTSETALPFEELGRLEVAKRKNNRFEKGKDLGLALTSIFYFPGEDTVRKCVAFAVGKSYFSRGGWFVNLTTLGDPRTGNSTQDVKIPGVAPRVFGERSYLAQPLFFPWKGTSQRRPRRDFYSRDAKEIQQYDDVPRLRSRLCGLFPSTGRRKSRSSV